MKIKHEVPYGDYLRLDRILDAQDPPGPDGQPRGLHHHDEMLFIVIHQVYELWFKQIAHEATLIRDLLAAPEVPESDIPRVVKGLGRIHEILKVGVQQLSVLETMGSLDFLAFRDSLGSASGFQSRQFREVEILAGLRDENRVEYAGASFERRFPPEQVARFRELQNATSLREAMEAWLERTPIEDNFRDTYLAAFDQYVAAQKDLHCSNPGLDDADRARVAERLDGYRESCRAFLDGEHGRRNIACLFIHAYRDEPLLHWPNALLDGLLDFEEQLRIWRFRHARMVERMIGLRVGTGGSSGVDYLDSTAGSRYRLFTPILEARSFLLPGRMLPKLQHPERYGFAGA
ncbi:MAG: tryptophan 2,3-dioxygenase family protein [Planctomycetota bacterium]|jgi:tryptophan 2,3-dioxygenase